jgi:hypothetical protein
MEEMYRILFYHQLQNSPTLYIYKREEEKSFANPSKGKSVAEEKYLSL